MIISLISAGSKLLSLPSKRKKSGKDMASSIMKRDQKLLPAGKPKKVTPNFKTGSEASQIPFSKDFLFDK